MYEVSVPLLCVALRSQTKARSKIVVLLNRPENVQAVLSVYNVHEKRRWLIRVATLQKERLHGDEGGERWKGKAEGRRS